jgi:hypothetical protein
MGHKKYFKFFCVISGFGLMFSILFNFIVDPYDIYRVVRIEGFNALKPQFRKHPHMGKVIAVERIRPESIVLGSSRAERGIDPEHPGWKNRPVYNLALAGINVYEIMRYLQHVNVVRPLKQVVLGLDFRMFNAYNKNSSNFEETRLRVNAEGERTPKSYEDFILSLTSLTALKNSFKTIGRQSLKDIKMSMPNGLRDPTYYRLNTLKSGGYRKKFIKSQTVYMGPSSQLFNGFKYENYFFDPEAGKSTFHDFKKLLDYAYSNNIDLHMFISPLHVTYWESLRITGFWPIFEKWKRELVRINEETAKETGKTLFSIWDFSGCSSISIEIIPPLGDAETQMKWYWEVSHYKKELGDLVLDRVLNYKDPVRKIPKDFGVLIDSKNIDKHLNTLSQKQHQFREENLKEVNLLKEIASKQNTFPVQ